jgi:hypothetical protein
LAQEIRKQQQQNYLHGSGAWRKSKFRDQA